jgi:hypothetical protein
MFTDEEKAVLLNALEMRLQRCQDNHWDVEAEVLRAIIEKINNSDMTRGE